MKLAAFVVVLALLLLLPAASMAATATASATNLAFSGIEPVTPVSLHDLGGISTGVPGDWIDAGQIVFDGTVEPGDTAVLSLDYALSAASAPYCDLINGFTVCDEARSTANVNILLPGDPRAWLSAGPELDVTHGASDSACSATPCALTLQWTNTGSAPVTTTFVFYSGVYTYTAAVPEPASWLLLPAGLIALAWSSQRRAGKPGRRA